MIPVNADSRRVAANQAAAPREGIRPLITGAEAERIVEVAEFRALMESTPNDAPAGLTRPPSRRKHPPLDAPYDDN